MTNEEKGVIDFLKEIKKAVEDQTVKKQKLSFKGRLSRFKTKKGWASVMYVHNNKSVEFIKAPIEDNTVRIGDLYYTATPDDILIFRNRPMLLLTEWSIKPLTPWRPKEHYEETEKNGELTTPQRHILSKLEAGVLKPKKKIALGGWIIIILLGIAAVYFVSQGGFGGG